MKTARMALGRVWSLRPVILAVAGAAVGYLLGSLLGSLLGRLGL